MWHSPLFTPDKRGLTPKRQALNSLEFLHGWAQNDLVNIHVSRLLNCEGDSPSDGLSGNCITVSDTAYLVSPGVFQRYAQEHPQVDALVGQDKQPDWQWVQKRF